MTENEQKKAWEDWCDKYRLPAPNSMFTPVMTAAIRFIDDPELVGTRCRLCGRSFEAFIDEHDDSDEQPNTPWTMIVPFRASDLNASRFAVVMHKRVLRPLTPVCGDHMMRPVCDEHVLEIWRTSLFLTELEREGGTNADND